MPPVPRRALDEFDRVNLESLADALEATGKAGGAVWIRDALHDIDTLVRRAADEPERTADAVAAAVHNALMDLAILMDDGGWVAARAAAASVGAPTPPLPVRGGTDGLCTVASPWVPGSVCVRPRGHGGGHYSSALVEDNARAVDADRVRRGPVIE